MGASLFHLRRKGAIPSSRLSVRSSGLGLIRANDRHVHHVFGKEPDL